jgi:phosphohistidine phosphatase
VTIIAIMRHAKSDWGQPGVADFDRPLNERGRKAAKRVGRELRARKVRFDRVFASPAARVRETLAELAKGYGEALDPHFERRIYEAGIDALFELVRTIPEQVHAPLLVGHNPGLHQLVMRLARGEDELRTRVSDNLPTAALALIELPTARWSEIEPGTGRIAELILPRELD